MSLKVIRNFFVILALLVLSFGGGYSFGNRDHQFLRSSQNKPSLSSDYSKLRSEQTVDFSLFWDVWERVSRSYINKKAIDPKKMLYGAISGMVAALDDPYTVFLTPSQNKEAKEELGGSFEGIGAQLGIREKKIVVIAPLTGTPAERVGIRAGDWIAKIDGKPTEGISLPEAVSRIRGPKGTTVVLSIVRDPKEEPTDFTITRETIYVKSVEWEVKKSKIQNPKSKIISEANIIYLKLSRFGDGTDREWEKAVWEINEQRVKSKDIYGLVLDLRNNPGGYLNGAVYIASEFLPENTVVVLQEYADGRKQEYRINRSGRLLDIPMVVIINKGSASASEIVAGALSYYKRARILGENSFGKGSIQEVQELPEGAGLHITTAKWLLPDGSWINGKGIKVESQVSMDEKNPEKDPPLEKAIEILVK